MIGLVIPVPKSVAESGYIRIWADANNNKTQAPGAKWELLAYEYDLDTKKVKGQYFEVTKAEVEAWMRSKGQEANTENLFG